MQIAIELVLQLAMIVLCILASEVMVRQLKSGAKQIRNTYKDDSETTPSYRLFTKSHFLWLMTYGILWILAGILFCVLFLEAQMLPVFVFYIIGEIRRERTWTYAESTRIQRRWTKQWREISLYRKLIDTKSINLMRILEAPRKLEELGRVARNARLVATFDPERMQEVTSREILEQRLQRYLHFLMNEASNKRYIPEEIYVVLFILSDDSDTLGEIAKDWLSTDLVSQFSDQNDGGTPDEI